MRASSSARDRSTSGTRASCHRRVRRTFGICDAPATAAHLETFDATSEMRVASQRAASLLGTALQRGRPGMSSASPYPRASVVRRRWQQRLRPEGRWAGLGDFAWFALCREVLLVKGWPASRASNRLHACPGLGRTLRPREQRSRQPDGYISHHGRGDRGCDRSMAR
jgi:hypothetical protein